MTRSRWFALVVCAGCTSPAKLEARSLVAAVDRYHKAENVEKPAAADALEKVACTDDEVCAAKDVCVKGASAMAKALRKQRDVERTMEQISGQDGAIPKDDPRAQALPAELDEVDRLMQESRAPMEACDEKIGSLRIKAR